MIDAHVHVWDLPDDVNPTPGHSATVETLLAEMDGAGIERAVLVQPSIYRADHSYLRTAVRMHPERFSAVGLLDPFAENALTELDRLRDELQPTGIRLHLKGSAADCAYSPVEVREVLERIGQADLTLSILTSPDALPAIAVLATELPETRIVIDHLGSPAVGMLDALAYRNALIALSACPNVWIKLSGFYAFSSELFPFADCLPLARWVIDHFGAERVVWGSDFPYATRVQSYVGCVQQLGTILADRSEADRSLISLVNATRLWVGPRIAFPPVSADRGL